MTLKLPAPLWTFLLVLLSLTINPLSSSLTEAFPMPPNTVHSTGGRAPREGTHSTVVNIAPFTDHVGNPALSIYRGKAKPNQSPLRHPYSFQIYITTGLTSTSPATSPLLRHLYDAIQGTGYTKAWGLAAYFLPHADPAAIRAHYAAEKAHRADGDWPMPRSYKIAIYEPYDDFAVVVDREEWERAEVGVGLLSWGLVPAAIVVEEEEGDTTPEVQWGRRPVREAGEVMDHMVASSEWWSEDREEEWQERENRRIGLL